MLGCGLADVARMKPSMMERSDQPDWMGNIPKAIYSLIALRAVVEIESLPASRRRM